MGLGDSGGDLVYRPDSNGEVMSEGTADSVQVEQQNMEIKQQTKSHRTSIIVLFPMIRSLTGGVSRTYVSSPLL